MEAGVAPCIGNREESHGVGRGPRCSGTGMEIGRILGLPLTAVGIGAQVTSGTTPTSDAFGA